jgi:3',5'-cyclic AMP phosphodiesterase CpdA
LRVLHFSDPHFDLSFKTVPLKKWFGKRAIGALNLLGGRGRRFNDAQEKMEALLKFKREMNIDLTICTGDFTALGLEVEIINASEIISPLAQPRDRFIALPGNHDIYLYDSLHNNSFNNHFGKFMGSDLPQYRVDEIFPFVRIFDEVVVVGLNSAKPNPAPWISNGYIPDQQLKSLEAILKDRRVNSKFIFIATHYSPRNSNGEPDKPRHSLINYKKFLEVCRPIERGAIITGHIHKGFTLPLVEDGLSISLFCAGSVTMDRRESLWIFDLDKKSFKATKGIYIDGKYRTIECEAKSLIF